MTDDEINRRVTEIEQTEFVITPVLRGKEWPPYATDWAWCGPLVEKYGIRLEPVKWHGKVEGWEADIIGDPSHTDDTPQRAICLAVIAAHEGKG